MAVVGDLRLAVGRLVVPTLEARAPLPTVGLPFARSGGQAVAQAPKHLLFLPASFLNR